MNKHIAAATPGRFRRPVYLLVLFTLLLGGCASYQPSIKQKTVQPGAEVLIGEFGYWKRDCTSRRFDIRIKQRPRFGTLRYEVGSLTIPDSPEFGTAGECVGKLIESKRIFYIAGPSFSLTDQVSFSVPADGLFQRKIYDIEIEIK